MNQDKDRRIGWPAKFVNTSISAGYGHEEDYVNNVESPNLTQPVIN